MSVLPVYALYGGRVSGSIGGWSLGETLVVLAVFLAVQSIADAAIALAFLGGCSYSDLALSFVWLVILGTAARMSWLFGMRRYLTNGA